MQLTVYSTGFPNYSNNEVSLCDGSHNKVIRQLGDSSRLTSLKTFLIGISLKYTYPNATITLALAEVIKWATLLLDTGHLVEHLQYRMPMPKTL